MSREPTSEDRAPAENETPPHTRTVTALRWLMLLALAALAVAGVARAAAHRQKSSAGAAAVAGFACPMHPDVTGGEGDTCPACNMRLTARRGTATAGGGGGALAQARAAGLRTLTVAAGSLTLAPVLEVPATVAPQERSVVQVTGRYAGWIETVAVPESGRRVEKGQVLATVHSPELLRAQKTLLQARRWTEKGDVAPVPTHDGDSTGDVLGEARFRVESYGLEPRDIAAILKDGLMRAVPVRAPQSGIVIRKDAVPGGYVAPGAPLFTIADLGVVSVLGELPEAELRHVRPGQEVEVRLRSFPDERWTGKVTSVAPVLEGPGGGARVRVDLPNPGLRLRPGSSATLIIKLPARRGLNVPPDSVTTRAGNAFVFVEKPEGFVRRAVTVGARTPEAIEILSGLAAGERIAATGTVLLEAAESAGGPAGAPP